MISKIIHIGKHMSSSSRITKSFTLEPEVTDYVARTKGAQSASERVNQLLKRAMLQERYDRLEAEAEAFFASVKDTERKETRAFQVASIRSITRD
jgi:hypothetical protein